MLDPDVGQEVHRHGGLEAESVLPGSQGPQWDVPALGSQLMQ